MIAEFYGLFCRAEYLTRFYVVPYLAPLISFVLALFPSA
jgi:hypothetical protein